MEYDVGDYGGALLSGYGVLGLMSIILPHNQTMNQKLLLGIK